MISPYAPDRYRARAKRLPATSKEHFLGVQFLRFVAAALVLISHITLVLFERLDKTIPIWDKGTVGVYIFFAISGFVMARSAGDVSRPQNKWSIFLMRRVIRIVPLYWIATTLKLLVVISIPAMALHSAFDPIHTLASYLFINHPNIEGHMSPLHAVGWTLNYEMLFYLSFSACLAMALPPTPTLTIFFSSIVALGFYFTPFDSKIIESYFQPIMLQFVLGCIIGQLSFALKDKSWRPLVGGISLSAGLVLLFLASHAIEDHVGWEGFTRAGIGSSLLVLGIALLEPVFANWLPTTLVKLGDSSYSLYLFHPFILGALIQIFLRLPAAHSHPILIGSIMTVACLAICHAIYIAVEKPITKTLMRRLATFRQDPT
jgi:peptidoglycan/LPS O-acetylase OafA/YrhL